jgi:hypothetical protein
LNDGCAAHRPGRARQWLSAIGDFAVTSGAPGSTNATVPIATTFVPPALPKTGDGGQREPEEVFDF